MNSSESRMNHRREAMINALLAIAGGVTIQSGLANPALIGIPSMLTGALGMGTALRRHLRLELTVGDYLNGFSEVADDAADFMKWMYGSHAAATMERVTIARLPAPVKALMDKVSTANLEEFEKLALEIISGSFAVAGERGTGKSTWLEYLAAKYLETFPDGQLYIYDPHYDRVDSHWLPGISREVFEERYLLRTPDQLMAALDDVLAEGSNREAAGDRTQPPILLLVDEAMQVGMESKTSLEKLAKGIFQIMNQFRKFKINVGLGLHSLKQKNNDVDSSALFQLHLICLGNILDDPNTKLPSSWKRNELVEQRQTLGKYGYILRMLGSAPEVKRAPNLKELLAEIEFDVDETATPEQLWWDAQDHEEIAAWVRAGDSLRVVSDRLGVPRSNSDPRYAEYLRPFVTQIKSEAKAA